MMAAVLLLAASIITLTSSQTASKCIQLARDGKLFIYRSTRQFIMCNKASFILTFIIIIINNIMSSSCHHHHHKYFAFHLVIVIVIVINWKYFDDHNITYFGELNNADCLKDSSVNAYICRNSNSNPTSIAIGKRTFEKGY